MDKKQKDTEISSKEELSYNIIMLIVMLGIIYGFAQLDAYKAKKAQQTQYQKIEQVKKTR